MNIFHTIIASAVVGVAITLFAIDAAYAKEKCTSFTTVNEWVGAPHEVVFNPTSGIYHAYYLLFKEGGVIDLTFTFEECWTGEAIGYSLEEFSNLGPINGKRFV